MLISAYIGMVIYNIILFVARFFHSHATTFIIVLSVVIANFLLDVFTIGVTLYLNLQATRMQEQMIKFK